MEWIQNDSQSKAQFFLSSITENARGCVCRPKIGPDKPQSGRTNTHRWLECESTSKSVDVDGELAYVICTCAIFAVW